MKSPFPGMDPYLEHPDLWPDLHNRLVAALGDVLTPLVAPKYYVALESRSYLIAPNELEVALVGRPDLAVAEVKKEDASAPNREAEAGVRVLEVEVPTADELTETWLEVRQSGTHRVVTVLEILSPANKVHAKGRRDYEEKRLRVFSSRTGFVEIDLLRSGTPMPVVGAFPASDYRILVRRGWRSRAELRCFNLRDPIPAFRLPLMKDEAECTVDLGEVFHATYERARFDLRLDYSVPPVPPLVPEDAAWAAEQVRELAEREKP